jgi:hypothetical protein
MTNHDSGLFANATYRVNPYADYARIRALTPVYPTTLPGDTV